MKLGRYRKLVAAVVGVVAIIFGPEQLGFTHEQAMQLVIGGLTALGVYTARNDT